jgi:bifunctional DNA-binding transcriptional regulator/antitoxin component of YhaV-PrlF toxin-antitoxin module
LPASVRKRYCLQKGDLVTVVDTPQGILISPQQVVAAQTLERIGAALREQGLSLDELIDSGREERGDLLRELYDIEPGSQSS